MTPSYNQHLTRSDHRRLPELHENPDKGADQSVVELFGHQVDIRNEKTPDDLVAFYVSFSDQFDDAWDAIEANASEASSNQTTMRKLSSSRLTYLSSIETMASYENKVVGYRG